MSRYLYPSSFSLVQPITSGGTAASTPVDATTNLQILRWSQVNQPGGVVGVGSNGEVTLTVSFEDIQNYPVTLVGWGITDAVSTQILGAPNGALQADANGKVAMSSMYTGANGFGIVGLLGQIPLEYVPPSIVNTPPPNITGPSSLVATTQGSFTITNFDMFTTYSLSAISGSVSRSGATITYTAPATDGAGGFIINGRAINVTITASGLNTPSITSPSNNATGVSQKPTFTASAFGYFGVAQTHAQTRWELSTASNFGTLVEFYEGAGNLTTWSPTVTLANDTVYYVRVRYLGSGGNWSNWSTTTTFRVVAFQGWLAKLTTADTKNHALATDSQGNIYTATSVGTSLFVTKWTNAGAIVWQRALQAGVGWASAYYERGYGITVDNQNVIWLTSRVRMSDTSNGNNYLYMYVEKIDSNGNLLTGYQFGENVLTTKLRPDTNGDIYLAETNTGFTGSIYMDRGSIYKISSNGSKLQMTFVEYYKPGIITPLTPNMLDCSPTQDGYVYGVGSDPLNDRPFICKFNKSGTLIWQGSFDFGTSVTGSFNSVSVDATGNVYAVGYAGIYGIVVKMSAAGAVIWKKQYTAGAGTAFNVVKCQANNSVFVIANANLGVAGIDALVFNIDANGAINWQRRLSSASQETIYDITMDNNGRILVAGYGDGAGILLNLPNTNIISNGALPNIPTITWNASAATLEDATTTFTNTSLTAKTVSTAANVGTIPIVTTSQPRIISTY